jgi:uncharacterized membrane-anchored protein YjiN (DUF445 family)
MTFKDNTPTFNAGNRKIVNYKDFIQHEPEEEAELKKMKRQFKKADQVNAVNQDHQSKYNKVTHKNDDLVKAEVEDKLDALEEGIFSDRYKNDETTPILNPLTIEEFSNLREAMYAVKKSDSPSAFQAKKFFSDEENFEKVVDKLRALLTYKP